jgi:hypothetical protein
MRPHGKARVDSRKPQAHAICDRCGFRYNHVDLVWEVQWIGPRLQNLRFLVCKTCYDKPQEQRRTIVLPPDPLPILNPRPEDFVTADNPISGIGMDPTTLIAQGTNTGALSVGTMLNTVAAFDSNKNKPYSQCANISVSDSSFGNSVGINWSAIPGQSVLPSPLPALPIQSFAIAGFTMTAPNNMAFLRGSATSYQFQGSSDGLSWVNISSGTTVGTIAETITVTIANPVSFSFHRMALLGDGASPVAIAQLSLNAAGPSAAQASGDIG